MTDKPKLTRPERGQVRRVTNRLLALERREFPSESNPAVSYIAMIMPGGLVTCNCKGWTFKRGERARQCKHTTALVNGRPTRNDGEHIFLEGV